MGLLIWAFLQRFPVVRGLLKRDRLQIRANQNKTIELIPYRLPPDRSVYWGKKDQGKKTHIKRNYHHLQENGVPADVVVEGKGTNIDLIEENPVVQEDSEMSDIAMDYFDRGMAAERRKHHGISPKDKFMIIALVACIGASLFALINTLTFSTAVMPEYKEGIRVTVLESVEAGIKAGAVVPAPTPVQGGAPDIILPT